MQSRSAFTIVEVLVVIVIIAILSTISVVAYNKVQQDARDTTRKGNAEVISNSLENYYRKNGEYPSVRQLVNTYSENTGTAVAALLKITTLDLLMPKMPSGSSNSLSPGPTPQNDYITYVGKSAVNDTACQSDASGGCDEFTMQYKKEAGDTITIESQHKGRTQGYKTDAQIATPTAPTTAITRSGANVVGTSNATSCSTTGSSIQYAIRSKVNVGSWSDYGPWSPTPATSTLPGKQGDRYYFQSKAVCVLNGVGSSEAEGTAAIYNYPIATPAAPTVSVSTSGATSTWSWNVTACPADTKAAYSTYYQADWGYDSGWGTAYTNYTSDYWDTSDQGYRYTIYASTYCYSPYVASSWSSNGYADYIRPITAPGAPSNFIGTLQSDRRKFTWNWTEPACASWNHPEVMNDMYINGSSTVTWYWSDTGKSGWHGYFPQGYYTPSFYVTQDAGAADIPSGGSTQMRSKYVCVNNDTGRTSSFGPVGTGPLQGV